MKTLDQLLVNAVRNNDANAVSQALKAGAQVNAKDGSGCTALHWAATDGSVDIVRLLLSNSAFVNCQNDHGDTPLHWATRRSHLDVVKLLFDKGADINAKDDTGQTSLHFAAYLGYTDFAKLLIDKGADINATNVAGQTPLHLAARHGSTDTVKLLIDKGTDINARDGLGSTPLHWATCQGHADTVRVLIDRGADINLRNSTTAPSTPLDVAVAYRRPEVAKLLEEAVAKQETGKRAIKPRGSHSANASKGATSPENLDRNNKAFHDAYIRLLERANRLHEVIEITPFDYTNKHFGSAGFICRVKHPETNEDTTSQVHFLFDTAHGLRIRTGQQVHQLGHDENGSVMKELDRLFPDDASRFAGVIIDGQSFAARANADSTKKSTDVSRHQ